MLVNRGYFCKACEHEFDMYQAMNDPLKKKCPKCNKNKLVQDLSGGTLHGSVKQYTTLGSIAEQNSKKLGTYGVQAKEEEVKKSQEEIINIRNKKLIDAGFKLPEKRETPAIPQKVTDLVKSGNQDAIKKYIMKGD